MAIRPEDRVIAKASMTVLPIGDLPLHNSLKNMGFIPEVQVDDRFEMGGPILGPLEFVQNLGSIVRIVFLFPGIAGRTDSRSPVEEIHQKPRIIRKAVKSVGSADKIGLDLGIFLQGLSGFGNLPKTANILQGQQFDGIGDKLSYLL